jgi:uncharacterized membrane protein
MSAYNKPKDRIFAALIVFAGFLMIPLTILWYVLGSILVAFIDAYGDMKQEFKGGIVVTARYAHGEIMERFAYRRARRETERLMRRL